MKKEAASTKYFYDEKREWFLIDARDKILGRLSVGIARLLRGKHKATYTPNTLCGDKVVVINARHIRMTGNKANTKVYDKYSGYPSGRKEMEFKQLMAKHPSKILYLSVKGMVPKNWLGKQMLRSLKIYPDDKYLEMAQKPKQIEV